MLARFRKYFISGLLVWMPIWVTLLVISFLVDMLSKSLLLLPRSIVRCGAVRTPSVPTSVYRVHADCPRDRPPADASSAPVLLPSGSSQRTEDPK